MHKKCINMQSKRDVRAAPEKRVAKPLLKNMRVDYEDMLFLSVGFHAPQDGMLYYIRIIRRLYGDAESELRGFFAPNEWEYIARCLRGLDCTKGRNRYDTATATSKADLCRVLRQTSNHARAELCGVDAYALCDRIMGSLGALHVLVVRRRVYELWSMPRPEESLPMWCQY